MRTKSVALVGITVMHEDISVSRGHSSSPFLPFPLGGFYFLSYLSVLTPLGTANELTNGAGQSQKEGDRVRGQLKVEGQ